MRNVEIATAILIACMSLGSCQKDDINPKQLGNSQYIETALDANDLLPPKNKNFNDRLNNYTPVEQMENQTPISVYQVSSIVPAKATNSKKPSDAL